MVIEGDSSKKIDMLQFFRRFLISKVHSTKNINVFAYFKQKTKGTHFSGTLLKAVPPQQTVRSTCCSSMFNGIRPEPNNKQFIQHTLKLNILCVEKFTVRYFY